MTLMAIILLLSGTAFGNTDAPPMDFSAGATAAGPAPGCSVTEVFSAQGPRLKCGRVGYRCMNGYPLLMESKAREGTKQCTDCCLPAEPEQGRHSMATQWGLNTLGPGQSASWFFGRSETAPFSLPVITVLPLSDFSPDPNGAGTPHFIEELDRMSFPTWNALGVSTLWSASRQAGFSRAFTYYLTVFNFSRNTVAYAFIEAEL